MSDKVSAAYHGSGTCERGCCWTPDLGCARGWKCEHHKEAARKAAEEDLKLQHIRDMERAAHLAIKAQRRQW